MEFENYELWKFFRDEHDLILTISEMDEIVSQSQKMMKKMDKDNTKEL